MALETKLLSARGEPRTALACRSSLQGMQGAKPGKPRLRLKRRSYH